MLLLTRMLSNHSHALHPHPLRSPLHAHTMVGRKSGIAAIAGIEEKEGKEGQQACRRRGRDDGRLLGSKRNAMGQEGDAL